MQKLYHFNSNRDTFTFLRKLIGDYFALFRLLMAKTDVVKTLIIKMHVRMFLKRNPHHQV